MGVTELNEFWVRAADLIAEVRGRCVCSGCGDRAHQACPEAVVDSNAFAALMEGAGFADPMADLWRSPCGHRPRPAVIDPAMEALAARAIAARGDLLAGPDQHEDWDEWLEDWTKTEEDDK